MMEVMNQWEDNLSFKCGIFKEELKNRFLCLVEVDGEDTLCYVPSSCRLSNFVSMVGKSVLLAPIAKSNARTKYSVEALAVGAEYVLLNMSKANRVVINHLHSRRFAVLGDRKSIKKECIIEGYKSDLYIEDTKTVVEIKSILSFLREAEFPSVYSQRAVEQLIKLERLLDEGLRVCYVFVSLNPKVKELTLNRELVSYRNAFHRCVRKGMMVIGVTIRFREGKPQIYSALKINI